MEAEHLMMQNASSLPTTTSFLLWRGLLLKSSLPTSMITNFMLWQIVTPHIPGHIHKTVRSRPPLAFRPSIIWFPDYLPGWKGSQWYIWPFTCTIHLECGSWNCSRQRLCQALSGQAVSFRGGTSCLSTQGLSGYLSVLPGAGAIQFRQHPPSSGRSNQSSQTMDHSLWQLGKQPSSGLATSPAEGSYHWLCPEDPSPNLQSLDQLRSDNTEFVWTFSKRSHLVLKDGVLYTRCTVENGENLQLVLPNSLKPCVLQGFHNELPHLSQDNTLDHICQRFCWRGIEKDVHRHIASCVIGALRENLQTQGEHPWSQSLPGNQWSCWPSTSYH